MITILVIFILTVNTVAEPNKLGQSSSASQSPNIYNCDNVEITYGRDPKDFEAISNLLKTNIQLSRTVQLQQKDLLNLREQIDRLSCRLSTRAKKENDSDAQAAVNFLEKDGARGGAKVDSILKLSYENLLREYIKDNKKQQEQQNRLAELAYECASALKIQFKFEEAKPFYEKAVEFSANNIDFKIALATNYYYLGDPQTALLTLKTAESLALKSEQKNISKFYYCLGWLFQSLGETDTAIYYFRSKAVRPLSESKRDSTFADNYHNIGLACYLKEEYDTAIYYFSQALGIDTNAYGKNHQIIADIYSSLGSAWGAKGVDDKAIDYFSRALAIDTTIYGNKHPNVADIYGGLAEAWDSKGDHDKAISYFRQALKIDTAAFGKKHPYIAKIYSSLGYAWYSKGVPDSAIIFYCRALDIDTSVYGKKHPDVARCYDDIGLAWDLKGEHDKAIASYEQGIKCGLNFWNEDHSDMKDLRNNLELSKKKKLSK